MGETKFFTGAVSYERIRETQEKIDLLIKEGWVVVPGTVVMNDNRIAMFFVKVPEGLDAKHWLDHCSS